MWASTMSRLPQALKARLKELGWIKGRNIELIWRNLEPDEAEARRRSSFANT